MEVQRQKVRRVSKAFLRNIRKIHDSSRWKASREIEQNNNAELRFQIMENHSLAQPELFWLALSTIAVALMWAPHIVQLILQEGFVTAVWDPARDTPHNAAWAQRARRAHGNAVENIAVFAPLVILVVITGNASTTTAAAAAVYFFARLAHFVAYAFAIPAIRVVMFLVGWGATMVQAVVLF